jgi:hypothetical protein
LEEEAEVADVHSKTPRVVALLLVYILRRASCDAIASPKNTHVSELGSVFAGGLAYEMASIGRSVWMFVFPIWLSERFDVDSKHEERHLKNARTIAGGL